MDIAKLLLGMMNIKIKKISRNNRQDGGSKNIPENIKRKNRLTMNTCFVPLKPFEIAPALYESLSQISSALAIAS
jgi:hypothetical protein